jgi:predicted short-subunit dehydrogenase-like oxidoreductase (DUF2520 family)
MASVSGLGVPQETETAGSGTHADSAILPGMPKRLSTTRLMKPRIAIVGAGNLARALAVTLHEAGYVIDQIVTRGRATSLRRARQLAREVGAVAVTATRAQLRADLVWFCVPDREIATAASAMKEAMDWHGKVALHSSGALTSDELVELRRRGAQVASVHPLMTFVRGSRPPLVGVPFAIEGDSRAVRAARAILQDLRGQPFSIRKGHKEAYHAWGMFLSPLLTALLMTSERVAAAAGVRRSAAKQRMLPILRQTLANYAAFDAAGAFSGPIIRGDIDTVKRHLGTLRAVPIAQEVYVALARAALAYLPGKNKGTLENVLKSLGREG